MRTFKDFGIKAEAASFVGDKIKITRILNKEITVYAYKIEDSKFGEDKKRLCLQIEFDNEKRIVFTGSVVLMNMIKSVPKDDGFPFKTIIIKTDERYEFS
ncbi:MAG TPA: hypothetical protein PKE39_04435 [Ignavibacteria bacterium]|nr:hypothetical protein [Ignavibacteria bacterium]HMQ98250.1 hypothetical protein [Ignavibacteria bacterium]